MTKNSFSFGEVNSMDAWGLKVIAHDTFLPPKRSNKITIPGRSGAYDLSDGEYNERVLTLECMLQRPMRKAQFREIIYALSTRGKIRLWDEPEKYYVGELYETGAVTVYPTEVAREFELEFLCAPFAVADTRTEEIATGRNKVPYNGTAKAPCLITLRNRNNFPVSNIVITATKRRI